jgi:hypothetical protein
MSEELGFGRDFRGQWRAGLVCLIVGSLAQTTDTLAGRVVGGSNTAQSNLFIGYRLALSSLEEGSEVSSAGLLCGKYQHFGRWAFRFRSSPFSLPDLCSLKTKSAQRGLRVQRCLPSV